MSKEAFLTMVNRGGLCTPSDSIYLLCSFAAALRDAIFGDSAKKGLGAHGKIRTGYIDAIIKYGSERNRYNGYHPEDLAYARTHLDESFMKELGYRFHPIELESANAKKGDGVVDAGNEHFTICIEPVGQDSA